MRRTSNAILAVAAAELAIVAAIAGTEPTGGAFAVTVALVLAPVAVWAVAGIAEDIAGPRFGLVAAALYAVLPVAGRVLFEGALRSHIPQPRHAGARRHPGSRAGSRSGSASPSRFDSHRRALQVHAGLTAAVVAARSLGRHELDERSTTTFTRRRGARRSFAPCRSPACSRSRCAHRGRRPPCCGWLGFFVLRGADRAYGDAFWTGLATAMPAIAVLIASLGLLVPRLRPQPAPATDPR